MFIEDLYNSLKANGFDPIKDTENTGEGFVGLTKCDGHVWYVALLVDGEMVSTERIGEINEKWGSFAGNLVSRYNLRHLIILNIIIKPRMTAEVADFVYNSEPFTDSHINYVYWAVDPEGKQVLTNKSQPGSILNIRRLIDDILSGKPAGPKAEYAPKSRNKSCAGILTYIILAANAAMFVLMELNGGSKDMGVLLSFGCISPHLIIYAGEYYRLLTSVFLHIGFMHLAYNCLSLYIFGIRIEKYYGKTGFLFIYIFSGILGSVFSVTFTRSIAAGASGAIFGLVGAMTVLTYKYKRVVDGLNTYTLVVYMIFAVAMGFLQSGVDNYGHLGGFIGGLISGWVLFLIGKLRAKRRARHG